MNNNVKVNKLREYKTFLIVLEISIIAVTLIAVAMFHLSFDIAFGIFTYLQYALYFAEIVSVIYGFIKRKIIARRYIIHLIVFVVQLFITVLAWCFIIDKLASGFAPF